MAAYEFAVNTEKLEIMIQELGKSDSGAIGEIGGLIKSIYGEINNLSSHWSGASYTAFKEQCENYKQALEGLVNTLVFFVEELERIRSDADTLEKNIAAVSSIG